jgi:N-acetylglucosamine kinase-like BadF-type ATPase
MSTATIDQLDQLNNGGNIRYDGMSRFDGAHAELSDIINTWTDPATVAPAAPIVMQADQVDQVGARIVSAVADMVKALSEHVDAGQVELLDAIHAGTAAPAPAAPADPAPTDTAPATGWTPASGQ